MSNPYAVPEATPTPAAIPPEVPHYSSMVQQMPVYAILLMVHGGIVILFALGIGLMAALFPIMAAGGEGQMADAEEEMVLRAMAIAYGVAAAVLGLIGLIQLWAGWKNFLFQRRVLGFVGIGAAFLSSLNCYCALTGLPLGIWGIVLLVHPDVQQAFRMSDSGKTRDEIVNHFSAIASPPPSQPPTPTL